MEDRLSRRDQRRIGLFICACFFFILMVGCEEQTAKTNKLMEVKTPRDVTIKPLSLSDEYQFESSYGWLDNNTIIYSASKDDQHYLFSYHLTTKKQKELFKTSEMLVEASVSPQKKYILVYTTSENQFANVHMLTSTGDEQYSTSIPSSEISFSWNEFDENQLLLDCFNEDWSYRTFVIQIDKKELSEIQSPQPFAQWKSKNALVYLQWDEDKPQLSAPLVTSHVGQQHINTLYDDIITFKASKNVLFTIQEIAGDMNNVLYVFYDWQGKELHSIKLPAISSYSDWMIPSYDLIEPSQSLITFEPYGPALIDQYDQLFQLSLYNWKTGEKRVLKEKIEAAPLKVSPEGDKSLYGNKLEQLIEF